MRIEETTRRNDARSSPRGSRGIAPWDCGRFGRGSPVTLTRHSPTDLGLLPTFDYYTLVSREPESSQARPASPVGPPSRGGPASTVVTLSRTSVSVTHP